ncbi:PAS domain S-box protein [Chloroflexales bacterium ZM16-3]|nr:PAS domain S-box protein [Chloroflexales bacterium ZM16-3]
MNTPIEPQESQDCPPHPSPCPQAKEATRAQAILEHSFDLVSICDQAGRITYINPATTRILGYRPEELIGQSSFSLLHPDDLARVAASFAAKTAHPGPNPLIELRFRHVDGSWRTLEATTTNLLDNPDVAGMVVNARDITERKLLEAQYLHAQKMEILGQLAGSIAHDLNNLLTAILGSATLALDTLPLGHPAHEDVTQILQVAGSAGELTTHLLSFARRQQPDPHPLRLGELLGGTLPLLRQILGPRITLIAEIPDDLGSIHADPHQLEQVLVNLAVNARDAMPDGGTLTISGTNLGQSALPDGAGGTTPRQAIAIRVADTGYGMSHEVQARLFEPFFTTKPPGKGTGLGLATCHGIVSRHGGTIAVKSTNGQGTVVTITLPRSDEAAASQTPAERAEAPQGLETVLVAEDDPAVLSLASRMLRRQGYTVLEAPGGPEALALAEEYPGPIHLLLTDVVMPKLGGGALALQMAQMRPSARVLFMSGYSGISLVSEGHITPDERLLPKPFTPGILTQTVRAALDA